jgi:hypothetical protein
VPFRVLRLKPHAEASASCAGSSPIFLLRAPAGACSLGAYWTEISCPDRPHLLSLSTRSPIHCVVLLSPLADPKMALSPRANSVLLLYLISSLTLPTYAKPNIPSTLLSLPGISTNLSPPDPLITQPAKIPHALFARDIATCGYISGNSAYPLTCPGGYSCTSTVQDLVGWACCNQIQCVGNYRKCADYGAGVCSDEFDLDASACSSIYTSILSCSDSAAPSCFVYARSTKIGDLETAYSYGCGASGGTVLVLATTTGAEGAAATSSNCQFTLMLALYPARVKDCVKD